MQLWQLSQIDFLESLETIRTRNGRTVYRSLLTGATYRTQERAERAFLAERDSELDDFEREVMAEDFDGDLESAELAAAGVDPTNPVAVLRYYGVRV